MPISLTSGEDILAATADETATAGASQRVDGLGKRQIVLNLGGISYTDSGALGPPVGLYTTVRSGGSSIKLANLTKRVEDLLQVTKLLTVFDVYAQEEMPFRHSGSLRPPDA